MGDDRQRGEVGTDLDDGAEPSYEDGSPVESPAESEPEPTQPDSAISS
jgi:hypothetical protein